MRIACVSRKYPPESAQGGPGSQTASKAQTGDWDWILRSASTAAAVQQLNERVGLDRVDFPEWGGARHEPFRIAGMKITGTRKIVKMALSGTVPGRNIPQRPQLAPIGREPWHSR